MARELTLAGACSDLLILALQINKPGLDLPDSRTLRPLVHQHLQAFVQNAERLGFGRPDIDDARYALVAMIDEAIQFGRWTTESKMEWQITPLQAELFGERNAGVGFFDRLERARKRSRDVLEVYYLCITLGFRGRYRFAAPEELQRLTDNLATELGLEATPRLAPHGLREGPPPTPPRSIPWVAIGLALLAVAIIGVVVRFVLLGSARDEALRLIAAFGG